MPGVMKSMNAISRAQSLYRAEHTKDLEIAPCHFSFVFTISKNPGLSQDEIARELSLNKSTVARALGQLEASGLVLRQSDAGDRRVLLVYPTEKMQSLLPRLREITREWNSLIEEGISKEELSVFLSVLCKMEEKAKNIVRYGEACEK